MNKKRVLFVCVHNAARSQMAEAFLSHLASDRFIAESAGLEPGELNPLVVSSMADAGIDISKNKTKSVFDMLKAGKNFDCVVTVCDESNAGKCPVFPGAKKQLHWSFNDPSTLTGSPQEKLLKVKIIRDQIKNRIERWLREQS